MPEPGQTGDRPRHPELLRLGEEPMIIGHVCGVCQRRAFPPDPFGCEACGADAGQLSRVEFASRGTVHAVATVHRHHNPEPATPFTVATVVLDDDVTLKAVLMGDSTSAKVGDRVQGTTQRVETADDGAALVDLRFTLESAGPA